MKKIIAVDVDNTVIHSSRVWTDWAYRQVAWTGVQPFNEPANGYDIGYPLIDWAQRNQLRMDVLDFWRQADLYDSFNETVHPDLQNILVGLSERFQVVFVSHCFPEHTASKRKMLERLFGGHLDFGFVAVDTPMKHYVGYDVLIDDNPNSLLPGLETRPGAKHILFNQFNLPGFTGGDDRLLTANCWDDVKNLLAA